MDGLVLKFIPIGLQTESGYRRRQ